MKKIEFIPFLVSVPFLLMANSPAPTAFPEVSYSDYSITDFSYGEKDSENLYPFTCTINNKGNSFLLLNSFYMYDQNDQSKTIRIESDTFDNCLNPHSQKTYFGKSQHLIEKDNLVFSSTVFKEVNELTPSKISYVSKEEITISSSLETRFRYTFSIEGAKVSNDYYYAYIIEYIKLGELHSFERSYWDPNKDQNLIIETEEDLTSEDLQINKIYAAKGRQKNVTASYIYTALIVVSIVLGVIILSSAIAAPIVILTIKHKKKTKDD